MEEKDFKSFKTAGNLRHSLGFSKLSETHDSHVLGSEAIPTSKSGKLSRLPGVGTDKS